MRTIEALIAKLARLRAADPKYKLFGAETHKYRLGPTVSERELTEFESRHGISLPEDYREFLRTAGNGGAGPFYGVFPLGMFDGAGDELEPWREGDGIVGVLSAPFPLVDEWNLPAERLEPPELLSEADEYAWQEDL